MIHKAIAAVVFIGLFFTITALAGVIPGRWEKVQAEDPGNGMIITLVSGEEMRAVFQEVTADSLVVVLAGKPRTLPKTEVAKITTAERRADPLWHGAVFGAGIGTLFGLLAMQLEDGLGAAAVPLAIGIWAGIGLGVDAAVQSRIVLYQAPGLD